jgi:hypothetical protein
VRKVEDKEKKKGDGEVKKEDGVDVAPMATVGTSAPVAPAAVMSAPAEKNAA